MADPDVVSNPSEYQKLAKSVSELDGVLQLPMFFMLLALASVSHLFAFVY